MGDGFDPAAEQIEIGEGRRIDDSEGVAASFWRDVDMTIRIVGAVAKKNMGCLPIQVVRVSSSMSNVRPKQVFPSFQNDAIRQSSLQGSNDVPAGNPWRRS